MEYEQLHMQCVVCGVVALVVQQCAHHQTQNNIMVVCPNNKHVYGMHSVDVCVC